MFAVQLGCLSKIWSTAIRQSLTTDARNSADRFAAKTCLGPCVNSIVAARTGFKSVVPGPPGRTIQSVSGHTPPALIRGRTAHSAGHPLIRRSDGPQSRCPAHCPGPRPGPLCRLQPAAGPVQAPLLPPSALVGIFLTGSLHNI